MLIAAVLTLFAFFLAGSTASDRESVLTVTIDSGIAIFALVIGFTLTFGIISVLGLWALELGGPLAWGLTGIIAGAIAGIMFGAIAVNGIDRGVLVIFAIMGGALMLLIRAIAGIRGDVEHNGNG
ncbi:MAG: hypothetical protein AAF557_25415 [Pseudomonadota bacterium]